ncbi:PAS domain-containing sensor histidine kinase [Kineobactrum sediminis]|uniref:histidine kinase n=1 Tax=Kineobactrum sediminis TaxID=1905677 RepID=A0A2N5Y6G8_9GAMM|nr:ATP-binding protein [Kineobactrum sediminis]PLW83977.1 PAS domain-containing sensor histidine kinase [Kineobactrum sediminis]
MDDQGDQLENTFSAFNRLSEELSAAYTTLAGRAVKLEQELARSRREKERQQIEKECLADRLAALLDSLPGGVVVFDNAGRVTESNAPAREWLGDNPEGRAWNSLLDQQLVEVLDEGRELQIGGAVQLTLSRRYLPGRGETIILLTDVTEQRQLQRELEQNRRLATMGEMAARVAHQIRTPLSTAMLYANHLTDQPLPAEQRQQFGANLLARLRDLDRMTRDMLGFVRGGTAETQPFSVATLLDIVRQSLAGLVSEGYDLCIEEHGGRTAHSRNLGAAIIRGDAQALSGALCNLVENAFQVGGKTVTVALSAHIVEAAAVELCIDDNGPGISPELCERVFEPFFSGRTGGTGLGLPVARSVAEVHGGSLRLEPRRDRQGARFVLRLPLALKSQPPHCLPALAGEVL